MNIPVHVTSAVIDEDVTVGRDVIIPDGKLMHCSICFAVVAENNMDQHLEWHINP